MTSEPRTFQPPSGLLTAFRVLAGGGALLFLAGAVLTPDHLWPALLLCGYFLFGLGVAALYFLALHAVTGAGWGTAFKRVPEAMTVLVPAGGVAVLAAVTLGAGRLYPWAGGGADLPPFKAAWLEPGAHAVRAVLYVAVLSAFAWGMRRLSRRQDHDPGPRRSLQIRRLSAAFLVVGSFVVWLASLDWLMALEPHWYSTMFSVYNFAGFFQGGLAALLVLLVWLLRRGVLEGQVRRDHVHDVAKFLFGMSTFWMYIWYSQYVLVWYTNLPEETVYFTDRFAGSWEPLFWTVPVLNWVLPFHLLIARSAKRSLKITSRVAAVVLLGHALELFVMIYPPLFDGPAVGLAEIGGLVALVGLVPLLTLRGLRGAALLPVGDPLLEESLAFHQ